MLQIVLIAVIKFLLLVCPIKSRTCVTNHLIVILFFVLLLISASGTFPAGYIIMQKVKTNEDTTDVILGMLVVTIVPSNLTIIILHVIKVVKLSKSRALEKEIEKINKY